MVKLQRKYFLFFFYHNFIGICIYIVAGNLFWKKGKCFWIKELLLNMIIELIITLKIKENINVGNILFPFHVLMCIYKKKAPLSKPVCVREFSFSLKKIGVKEKEICCFQTWFTIPFLFMDHTQTHFGLAEPSCVSTHLLI